MNEQYDFCPEKNRWLKKYRSISFEEIIAIIATDSLLDVVSGPNQQKYSHQRMYLIDLDDDVYVIPFVRKDKHPIFLKTIFKSRKMTKQYLLEKKR